MKAIRAVADSIANRTNSTPLKLALCAFAVAAGGFAPAVAQLLQGGVEEKATIEPNGYPSYPSPQMVQPQTPTYAPPPKRHALTGKTSQSAMQGGVSGQGSAPLQGGVSKVLPPDFLGVWNVRGQRQKVVAAPQFQAGAENAFSMGTQDSWTISGSPGNYSFGSSTGVQTSIIVDKVQGGIAYIRYQHQIKNTMAREAIVLSLMPGGAQFNGLERIAIMKPGEPQPRAQVTYQLFGNR
jgi:hypothetical protein